MTTLRIEEAGLDMTHLPYEYGEAERSCHFIDHLLNGLLSSNRCIRSLAHFASAPLHPSVFHNLRTQPTQLRTVVLRASIQYGLRGRFNEPIRWSSTAT